MRKSALPLLSATAASRALSLRKVAGSRSALACPQRDQASPGAEGLLALSVTSQSCYHTCQPLGGIVCPGAGEASCGSPCYMPPYGRGATDDTSWHASTASSS